MIRRPLLALVFAASMAMPSAAAESPFEDDLLRNLCGEEGQDWRRRMEQLIEAEEPDDERRARFIARFNRGYSGFEANYTTCTPSAIEAIERYIQEGEALSRDTASRYGNQ